MKAINKSFLVCLTLAFTGLQFSCENSGKEEAKSSEQVEVDHFGNLSELMHEGKVFGRVGLDTLEKENLYGLGAIEGLKGELLMLNGQSYTAKADSTGLILSQTDSVKAALWVQARVLKWDTLNMSSTEDLSGILEAELSPRTKGKASPFLILARPKQLNYHVLNFQGEKPDARNHKQGSLTGGVSDQDVIILGFYAHNAEGIYTHKGSKTHLHFISESLNVCGHVDKLDLSNDSFKLLIPSL